MRMRFHAQTAGSTLTALQPHNNIVRTTLQALAAVLGGTQSLHTNAFDEALGLPTEESARLALRTQQVIAYESGVTDTVDPLAGSYFVESLTDRLEEEATALLEKVESLGGAVSAIESGFVQRQIADAAYDEARRIEDGESVVVGVNRFAGGETPRAEITAVPPELEAGQVERLGRWRSLRNGKAASGALEAVAAAAAGNENLLPVMKEALAAGATVGEVSAALEKVFGTFAPQY